MMRLPRVRFTVRRMMIAVAIAGLFCATFILWRRSREYWDRAEFFAEQEQNAKREIQEIDDPKRGCGFGWYPMPREKRLAWLQELWRDMRRYKEKYYRAAYRPWESVPDEPDE